MVKTIAVLTSGGDAPGMNACIRAVVRVGLSKGLVVLGVRDGYKGLVEYRFEEMDRSSVANIVHHGGTILGTSRFEPFKAPESRLRALDNLRDAKVNALVVIGGDGSFRGAEALHREGGIAVIGVPGTIDNDVIGTDYTIGFDTAVNTALEATDKLRDTADALGRAFVVEVMGRHSGMLALQVGLAAGAAEVLVPEIPVDLRHVAQRIYDGFKRGRRSSIIVVAEGFGEGGAVEVAKAISTYSPLDCRVTVLGHIQRGGDPTAFDRVLGGVLGDGAIEGLLKGYTCHMVGQAHQAIVFVPLEDTWKKHRYPSEQQLHLLKELSG